MVISPVSFKLSQASNERMCATMSNLSLLSILVIIVAQIIPSHAIKLNTTRSEWPSPLILVVDSIIPANYRSNLRPFNGWGGPLNVSVSVQVNRILATNEIEQSYELDMLFTQHWRDERLNISHIYRRLVIDDPNQISRFWLPDTYFVNGRSISIMASPRSAQKLVIDDNQMLSYTTRLDATFYCYMNLLNYPHDYQYCRIDISSLTYNTTELVLSWERFAAMDPEYSKFKISYYWSGGCFNDQVRNRPDPCLSATLKLTRRLSYYIIRFYLLTFLCAAIALLTFWIPVNAWPARVTIQVTSLLAIINQDISIQNEIGVTYVVSFHWWMMFIEFFITGTFFEYGFCIAWAHFVTDKQEWSKTYHAQQSALAANPNLPIQDLMPPKQPGYYFGNDGWYRVCGHCWDRILYFFFGTVDFRKDPFVRNKVDYAARLVFLSWLIMFVFIYSVVCFIYWSNNYYDEG